MLLLALASLITFAPSGDALTSRGKPGCKPAAMRKCGTLPPMAVPASPDAR